MKEKEQFEDKPLRVFETVEADFQKWYPIFYRLGLKPRRYFKDDEAVYMGTGEGWFRLSLVKYDKRELQWLRIILQYLEERSFVNWAVPWQKTIIWEESDYCYLIQPWIFSRDCFCPGDPASLGRIAEILAEFYRCGKDYRENKGIEILRDHWSPMELQWELEFKKLKSLSEDLFHEKVRKEIHALKKDTLALLEEYISIWKTGINTLFEHHLQAGVIGHGKLLAKYIVWCNDDYYLLNWENLSFQPKILDLASLINDIGIWEPEWIVYLLNEYSRIQPFWPEEYQALKIMLQYPTNILNLLSEERAAEVEYKHIKGVRKELKHKERCLARVWRELGSDKRWGKSRSVQSNKREGNGKMSMVLSPMETWGGFTAGQFDSLIHVKSEQRLPADILERLTNQSEDRVLGGRDGNIMDGTTTIGAEFNPGTTNFEIEEDQVETVGEKIDFAENLINSVREHPQLACKTKNPNTEEKQNLDPVLEQASIPKVTSILPKKPAVLSWGDFPKPLKKEAKR